MTPEDPSLPPDNITPQNSSLPPDMAPETNLHKTRKLKGDRSNWDRIKLEQQREFGETYISTD